jgi:hypothetical protein
MTSAEAARCAEAVGLGGELAEDVETVEAATGAGGATASAKVTAATAIKTR